MSIRTLAGFGNKTKEAWKAELEGQWKDNEQMSFIGLARA